MYEAMASENKMDYVALDGTVVKDAVVQMIYSSCLKQLNINQLDYGLKMLKARNYSTQYRHGMSSKLGKELYDANSIGPLKKWLKQIGSQGTF